MVGNKNSEDNNESNADKWNRQWNRETQTILSQKCIKSRKNIKKKVGENPDLWLVNRKKILGIVSFYN